MDRFPKQFLGRLDGKVAIVTGAGTRGTGVGTGRAMAVLFAGEGAKVCLADCDHEAAEDTLRLIEQIGGEAFVTTGSVTSDADCRRFVAETVERYGRLDILVNNVGITGTGGRADTIDMDVWNLVLDTNLSSVIRMSGAVISPMREHGGGVILNIASVAGMLAYGSIPYAAAKGGMIQLTRELAFAHGREGIRVNTIAPGHILTPLIEGRLSPQTRADRRKAGPLGIEGDAWDVAYAALFLATEEARFITGACLPVDGGVTSVGSTAAIKLINAPD